MQLASSAASWSRGPGQSSQQLKWVELALGTSPFLWDFSWWSLQASPPLNPPFVELWAHLLPFRQSKSVFEKLSEAHDIDC